MPSPLNAQTSMPYFLQGGGEMGELTRNYNWAATKLGPPETWPQNLQNTLSIILRSGFPMLLWWGEDLIQFYNDAYRPCLGLEGKHPTALGQRGEDCWPEIWPVSKPLIDQVILGGESTWSEDQLIPIYRNNKLEDVYWTFSYSPVMNDNGLIGGILVICTETTKQIQAYKDIKSAKNDLEFAVGAAELGTWDLNPITNKFIGNNRLKGWFGIAADEEIELSKATSVIAEADRMRVLLAIGEAMTYQSGGNYNIEYTIINPETNTPRYVRAKGKALFNELQQPVRFSGILQDVSEEKVAAESVEKQARLAAIVNSSDDTILSKTLQGVITSWNIAAERMFGYTEAEIIGKHISIIIPPARLKEEEFIIGQIASGNKIDHFETIRIAKDGREIPLSLSVSPIMDNKGNIIGASKIARDISAQWAAQEVARRYTERLEIMNLMVESVSEELDLNKILQKITDATTELTGAQFGAFFYNSLDEKGEAFSLYTLSGAPKEAFEKFGMPRNTAVFGPTFAGEGVVRVDDITKDPRYGKNGPHHGMPEGHLPVVSYLAVPVISRSGAVIGGLLFGHPQAGKFTKDHESLVVSIAAQSAIGIDNAKLYEQVKLLNEKKDEFIGLASHELKTPLTSINGYLQILSRLKMDEKNQRFVNKTLQQVQKLTTLVNDLLDISKIEAGQLQLNVQKFDVKVLLDEVIELIQHSNENYQITLNTTVENCIIEADSQRVEQVLLNLLTNAIKYSPGANRIELSLTCTPNEVQVDVKDFGLGIAENKINQIFSRFYRVEDVNPTISGLGIGLYLACEIVNRHKGKLWVDSEVGIGSTFHFTVPLNH